MTTDSDKIGQLRKGASQRSATSSNLAPWQELMGRFTTVPGHKAIQAAEAISGLAGGWAAFFSDQLGISFDGVEGSPAPPQVKSYKLGQPGLPEINFAPYNHGTNRFGSKGPSLLGHPISLSVVGPTLKTPFNTWQWGFTDNTGLAIGDQLAIDTVDSALSTVGAPVPPAATTLGSLYNLPVGSADDMFPGGLYMVILQSGAPGQAPGANSGLSDGFIGDGSGVGKTGLTAKDETSEYEIFRVKNITSSSVELDPGKRVLDYFSSGGGVDHIRSVMFFEPHLTRLVSVPGSGGGKGTECAFVIIPPDRAATGEFLPPYDTGITGDGSWLRGGFDSDNLSAYNVGVPGTYHEKVAQPISRPTDRRLGRAQRQSTGVLVSDNGRMLIESIGAALTSEDIGKVLRVYRVSRSGTAPFGNIGTLDGANTTEDAFLGWYEILSTNATHYIVRRIPEVNPQNGHVFWGSTSSMWIDDSVNPGDLRLEFTVHDPISSLYTSSYNDPDLLEAARLTNLIDPSWAERTVKTPGIPYGASSARPDRSIWNTRPGGNPGSMLDLGFRMVLYPAIEGTGAFTGTMLPDYGHPIDSREVTLDPSIDETQYLDIDYSSGVVLCSHIPVPGVGCSIAPNGIVASDNPRGEIVLFASCVPYSMEKGQTGGGFRATSLIKSQVPACAVGEGRVQADVFGGRISAPLASVVDGAGQVITSGVAQTITLEDVYSNYPDTGFLDLRKVNDTGPPAFLGPGGEPLSLFGYTSKRQHFDTTDLKLKTQFVGCYGGASYGTATVPASGLVAVLRRDVHTPVTGDGIAGTAYEFDTTYGFSKRSDVVRFEDASISAESDGSLTVSLEGLGESTDLFGDLFSTWVIDGGSLTFPGGVTVDVASTTIILQGKRYLLPSSSVTVPTTNGPYYIYADGHTDPTCPSYAYTNTLPIPSAEQDALIAKVEVVGGVLDPFTYLDMTDPLRDIDRRVDITVGDYGNWAPVNHPHFKTLTEAIAYVGEVGEPPSGNTGRAWRILVLGETTENGPISIPTDGMVIEGAQIRRAGGPGTTTTIKWGRNNALIDLNGKKDLVFRNLAFEFEDGGQPLDASPDRVLFENTGGMIEDVLISNVRFEGNGRAHGFYLDTNPSGGGAKRLTIEHCISNSITDFAVLFRSGAAVLHCSFHDNYFEQDLSVYGTGQTSYLSAFYFDVTHVDLRDNHVLRNHIKGFSWGVRLLGAGTLSGHNLIASNRIEDTLEFAIQVGVGDANVIRGNYLRNIHTSSSLAGSQPVTCGVWLDGTSLPGTRVLDNHIEINTPTVSKRALLIGDNVSASSSDVEIQGNIVNGPIWSASSVFCTDNVLDLGFTVGQSSKVTGNHLLGGPLSIALVGPDSNIRGNDFPNLTVDDDCRVEGNLITTLFTASSVDIIVGNTIGQIVASTGNESDTLISDNIITYAGGDGINWSGLRNIISGNTLNSGTGDITVSGNNNTVSGNRCRNILTSGSSSSILGNQALGGVALAGDYGRVSDNDIQGYQTIVGSGALVFSGDRMVIADNTITSSSNGHIDIGNGGSTDMITITGNTLVGNIHTTGAAVLTNSVIADNQTPGDIRLVNAGNNRNVISGNRGNLFLSHGDGCNVTGNQFDSVNLTGDFYSLAGNQVNTSINIGGVSSSVTGNEFDSLAVVGDSAVVDGNRSTGGLTVTGQDTIISNNQIEGGSGIALSTNPTTNPGRATISGNWALEIDIRNTGGQNTVTGNWCTSFTFGGGAAPAGGSNNLIQDNYIQNDVTISTGSNKFEGNRCLYLDVSGDKNSILGNRIVGSAGVSVINLGPCADTSIIDNVLGVFSTNGIPGVKINAICTDVIISKNEFLGGTDIEFSSGATKRVLIDGNMMGDTSVGLPSTIKIDGSALSSTATDLTISNNQTGEIHMGGASRVTIRGNNCIGGMDLDGSGIPYTGIYGSGIEWMVQGNRVHDGTGGYNSIVLTSVVAGTGHVITGNICANIGTTESGGGSPVAGSNIIAHGNRVSAGTVYGSAVVSVASVITDNAQ